MSETTENLRRKIKGASDLGSVVRSMKAMAGSNIVQFEMAVESLSDYYRTVALGILAYFKQEKIDGLPQMDTRKPEKVIGVLVFGSDMGLVGSFNDRLAQFSISTLKLLDGVKEVWTIGERIQPMLNDVGYKTTQSYIAPGSVQAVTPLVVEVIIESEKKFNAGDYDEFYVIYNRPSKDNSYEQKIHRLLPLDEKWRKDISDLKWPTHRLPQVLGNSKQTLAALISEYLFITLYRAAAESLAAENTARLESMERAETNIDELLFELSKKYHLLRQSAIDEELFDLISGFEALSKKQKFRSV